MAACSVDAAAMIRAEARATALTRGLAEYPTQTLRTREPRNIHGRVLPPPMNTAVMAMPAGGKMGAA
jgi:hypothetical protein